MVKRVIPWALAALAVAGCSGAPEADTTGQEQDESALSQRPNIIYILADDLGYGDLGSYGQTRIKTPNLDQMAKDGARFTNHHAEPVCSPSRYGLMTGMAPQHALIRSNPEESGSLTQPSDVQLRPNTNTVARMLKSAGYRTDIVGKWGLATANGSGMPRKQGFDSFFGYATDLEAHDYFPQKLWRNDAQVNNGGKYAPYLFTAEAKRIIVANKASAQPFFLYLAYTNPHAGTGGRLVPDDRLKTIDASWPAPERQKAAAIELLDEAVGEVLAQVKASGLDDNTIIFFASDNGPQAEGGVDPSFFKSRGGLIGEKRDVYEGGTRVPLLVRYPGHVKPGVVVGRGMANWDFWRTAAEYAGVTAPSDIDGQSMITELSGVVRPARSVMYFEHDFQGNRHDAIIADGWKLVRHGYHTPFIASQKPQLFHIDADPVESNDVASANPARVTEMLGLIQGVRDPSPLYPGLR